MTVSSGAAQMGPHIHSALGSHLAVVAGYDSVLGGGTDGAAHPLGTGIPVSWPEDGSNRSPEPGKVRLASSHVFCSWAESTHQNGLLCSNALRRGEPGGDGGDDGGAVAAAVGGGQGQEGGGEDEGLH